MDTYHWDALVTYHWDVVGCFIWDLYETSWKRTDETKLVRPLETSSRRSNEMSRKRTTETSWRRSTETSLGVSFETYLAYCWGIQRDVVTTTLWCLVASRVFNFHVRISKYKNNFAKGYVPNWSEEVFVITKAKNTVAWTYVISYLKDEEIVGTFYENICKKQIKKSLE